MTDIKKHDIPDTITYAVARHCGHPDRDIHVQDWNFMHDIAKVAIDAWEAHCDSVDIAAAEASLAEGGDPIPADEVWKRLEDTP